jgi:hypothetical protein
MIRAIAEVNRNVLVGGAAILHGEHERRRFSRTALVRSGRWAALR